MVSTRRYHYLPPKPQLRKNRGKTGAKAAACKTSADENEPVAEQTTREAARDTPADENEPVAEETTRETARDTPADENEPVAEQTTREAARDTPADENKPVAEETTRETARDTPADENKPVAEETTRETARDTPADQNELVAEETTRETACSWSVTSPYAAVTVDPGATADDTIIDDDTEATNTEDEGTASSIQSSGDPIILDDDENDQEQPRCRLYSPIVSDTEDEGTGSLEEGSQDHPIIIDDDENDQEQPRYRLYSPDMPNPTASDADSSDTDSSDTEDEETAFLIRSPMLISDQQNRKPGNRIAWGDPGFEKETASKLDSAWKRARKQWDKIYAKWFESDDNDVFNAAIEFDKIMIMTEMWVIEKDYAAVSQVNDAWKNSERGLKGKRMSKGRRWRFSQILERVERHAIVLAIVRENPHVAKRKNESEDEDYGKAPRRAKVQRR